MQTVTDAAAIRAAIRGWRAAGQNVGFVPTMGNLHAGHHSLLKLARARADRVVASVFVNPTQFGPGEDFERYPRTLAQDQAGLAEAGCDILFAPEVSTMYPFGPAASVSIHVPVITDTLEGAHRPGHFDGVATVVAKLFSLVQPDIAVFGQKDFQQLKVIERMVADLSLSVKVMSAPTLRDDDGLAMSSRNQYLSPRNGRGRRRSMPRSCRCVSFSARVMPGRRWSRRRRRAWSGRASCPTTWPSAAPRTWPNPAPTSGKAWWRWSPPGSAPPD